MSSFFKKTNNEYIGFGDITILYAFLNIINNKKPNENENENDMSNFIKKNKYIFSKKILVIKDGTILHALAYGGNHFKDYNINNWGFKLNFVDIINKSITFFHNHPMCINEIPEHLFFIRDNDGNTPLDIALTRNVGFKELLCNKEGAVDDYESMKEEYYNSKTTLFVSCMKSKSNGGKRKTKRFRNKKKKTIKRQK